MVLLIQPILIFAHEYETKTGIVLDHKKKRISDKIFNELAAHQLISFWKIFYAKATNIVVTTNA